jgi:taurine-pyruvate aminotransferase
MDSSDGSCCKFSASELDRVLTWELSETVAGVIMEPIITGGGVLVPHDEYLKEVREICDRHGVLLIIDEVINGFGRTGKPFGFMHANIKPDIVTMAKGLTSAYMPLSATAVRKDIYEVFKGTEEYDFFRHVNTFGGSPAACAVALKNLEIMEKENLVERSKILGERLYNRMQHLYEHPNVGDVRGRGLLLGIEMVEDKKTKEPASSEKLDKVIHLCKQKGLIIGKNGTTVKGYNNVLTLSPPLSISDEELEFIIETITESIFQI